MTFSIWISLGALVFSITALTFTIKNGIAKARISVLEMRNSFRANVHDSTMEILLLIEKIRNQAITEQKIRIVEKLVETAEGMTLIYKKLKKDIEVPWCFSSSILIQDYGHLSSEMKEFNLILAGARAEFNNGNFDKLEKIVVGLHIRILGSRDI